MSINLYQPAYTHSGRYRQRSVYATHTSSMGPTHLCLCRGEQAGALMHQEGVNSLHKAYDRQCCGTDCRSSAPPLHRKQNKTKKTSTRRQPSNPEMGLGKSPQKLPAAIDKGAGTQRTQTRSSNTWSPSQVSTCPKVIYCQELKIYSTFLQKSQ